ncbi:MAG: hypothetical protein NUV78_01420 [Candidatus Zambryskibacteria bacterium]|nr:hypothetical protein [Candidatus Zambryskibacteria bacterium]
MGKLHKLVCSYLLVVLAVVITLVVTETWLVLSAENPFSTETQHQSDMTLIANLLFLVAVSVPFLVAILKARKQLDVDCEEHLRHQVQ